MLGPGAFSTILKKLVSNIHRTNVGTLDALLIRMAGSFSGDLGLPPEWSIGDEPTAARIEAEALQRVLSRAGPSETAELVRMTMRGESGRGVHQRLLAQLLEIRDLVLLRDIPDSDELWTPPRPASFGNEAQAIAWNEVTEAMQDLSLPVGASGKPDGNFRKAMERGIQHLEAREWEKFCTAGLGSKILEGQEVFHNKPIPPDIQAVVRRALSGVAGEVLGELSAQGRALRALTSAFHEELDGLKQQEGSYRFSDIPLLLASADPLGTRQDLWYRLDQKAHHLLLDEFQDTSRAQWEAIEPLAQEILSGHAEERSALFVADPKQSIYGWRGAEPDMARRIGRHYGLRESTLDKSYRSSVHILETVNQVFGSLSENPVFGLRDDASEAAEHWSRGFKRHIAARDLDGYVCLEAGPSKPASARSDRPEFMAWAALRIAELHEAAPGATLGVLVRRNAAVSRIIGTLRGMGVDVSEEGAGTVADSPSVAAFLAALRLADHPGDRLARYHVATCPLGMVVGITDPEDSIQARTVALGIRRDLLEKGYPSVLESWVRGIFRHVRVGTRERGRLSQLLELAYRWEGRAGLRPTDFVRWIESESVEAPTGAMLRVMTVHQAKGLEFDVVVLPELHLDLTKGRGLHQAVLPLRDPESGRIRRVFPSLPKGLRPLFPEMEEAGRQDLRAELHDALGVAYVAMTRARHALHLLVESDQADGKSSRGFTFAGLVLGGLGLFGQPITKGDVLYKMGNSAWASGDGRFLRKPKRRPSEGSDLLVETGPPASPRPRNRLRPQKSPSALSHEDLPSLGHLLSGRGREGRRIGSIVHEWLETLIWVEDWHPDPDDILRMARRVAPDLTPRVSRALFRDLSDWLEAPALRNQLSASAYPKGSEVLTEVPFAMNWEGSLYQGRVDRIVLWKEGQRISGAEVLDYKTDPLDSSDSKAAAESCERYRPQLNIYRRAVSARFGVPVDLVAGTLLVLRAGSVQRLHSGAS